MDLRDLTYFEVIAELGHLGQAADRLGRTKPALTKCVHRLEAALGAKLFQREGRSIVITPAGSLLLAQARRSVPPARRPSAIWLISSRGLPGK